MYRGLRVIAIAPARDEQLKIGDVVRRTPREIVDEVLVIDDASRDGTAAVATAAGANVVRLERSLGVGAALRVGYRYALEHGFDVAVVMAGNNKDSPEEIPRLLDPIADLDAGFVQGSRYRSPGADFGEMPLYRKIATRIHPILFSLVAGRRVSDSTNGFRAVHRRVLSDHRLNLDAQWLDQYELEPYLYLKAILLGHRVEEVAVTKRYPPRHLGQTKMRPLTGWWSILRPLVLVGLRLRR